MRRAVSLIELVIAIVVIGIAAMSLPLILTQTSNNIKLALQQEAILNAKSYIGIIQSHPWDKNSMSSNAVAGGRIMVLGTSSSSDSEFNLINNKRIGHIDGTGRRAMLIENGTLKSADGHNFGGIEIKEISLDVVEENLDYILSFKLQPEVKFVSDSTDYSKDDIEFKFETAANNGHTNIKIIEMNATNTNKEQEIDIVLRSYSSNIGEYILLERNNW